MTTAINPGCTCGAANFGPGAAHMEGCYVLLLKEAEAVTDAPVRQVGTQPVNPSAPADELYAPEPTTQRRRTKVEPPPLEDQEYTNIMFIPNMRAVEIDAYHPTGLPTIVRAGTLTGELVNRREHEGKKGLMWFCDLKIESKDSHLNGVEGSFIMGTILKQLLENVPLGTTVEISRKSDGGSNGKLHMYEVYVLD